MNMLVNAQHAIEGEGKITLKTRVCPELRAISPGEEPVEMVEISVIDTGCGISEDDMQRIFDPFFSTKSEAKGVGLGLAVVYGIVQRHEGDISVKSEPGRGARITMHLPRDPAARVRTRSQSATGREVEV